MGGSSYFCREYRVFPNTALGGHHLDVVLGAAREITGLETAGQQINQINLSRGARKEANPRLHRFRAYVLTVEN